MVDSIDNIIMLCRLRNTTGALVLYSIHIMVYFFSSTHDVVVDAQFHKFCGRPFARVLHAFLTKDNVYHFFLLANDFYRTTVPLKCFLLPLVPLCDIAGCERSIAACVVAVGDRCRWSDAAFGLLHFGSALRCSSTSLAACRRLVCVEIAGTLYRGAGGGED